MPHTPGPWTCHSGSVYVDGPTVYPKGPDNGIPIAHMDREPGNGTYGAERDANARLIAAAPAMLAALRSIANNPDQPDVQGVALEAIRLAIKES